MCRQSNRLILLIVLASGSSVAATEGTVVASLTPTKGAYLQGEPIELRLTVTNGTNETVGIEAAYPSFGSGIRLGPKADSTTGSGARIAEAKLTVGGGKFPIVSTNPGETWVVRVYLQRSMGDLSPGTHDVAYSVSIPCLLRDVTKRVSATGHGVVRVVVLYAEQSELAGVIAGYADELKSGNSWVRRSAEEALSVTSSPLVIPYLRELVKLDTAYSAVLALAKFRSNPEAESLVLETARDGSAAQAISALSVLEQWNYPLTESEFRALLSREDVWLKLAALRYAEKVGGSSLIPAIAACTEDGNELVAEAAKRVQQTLAARKK